MPKFFFHLLEDGDRTEDEEGRHLPDVKAAYNVAVAAARDIMSEQVKRGEALDGQVIEVTDATGAVAFTLPFKEALP